jgi:hypothetical protein
MLMLAKEEEETSSTVPSSVDDAQGSYSILKNQMYDENQNIYVMMMMMMM